MAGYQVIADVSGFLLARLRGALCPAPLRHPEQLGQFAPGAEDNEALLNLYLYRLRLCPEWRPDGREYEGRLAVALQYLLFFNRSAQTPLSPATEQQALGRLLEWAADTPAVELAGFHGAATAADPTLSVTLLRLNERENQELWSGLGQPLRPSLCLEVAPVLLGAVRPTAERVTSMEGELRQQ